MTGARFPLTWSLVLFLTCSAVAQSRHDPLNRAEINELRDTAQQPNERLELYIKFSRLRFDAVEQAHADAKATDRGHQVHDLLGDFLDVYDELDDNVDTFANRRNDIRKALAKVIEADTEFQAKLRALKDAATTSREEAQQYAFVLQSAIEAVDEGVQDHRQLLSQQEEAAKHKRLIKP
jgi:predicted  nucleic acid-binding Zn-ribbon protein